MHISLRNFKDSCLAIISLTCFIPLIGTGQNSGTGGTGGAAPAKPPSNVNNTPNAAPVSEKKDNAVDAGATDSALDYLFNRKAKDGSVVSKGSTSADALGIKAISGDALSSVSNSIDPLFESFLNSKEQNMELVQEYHTLLRETVTQIRDKKLYDAIANLYVLNRFNWDGQISEQLANRVLALRDMRSSQLELERGNAELEKKIVTANRNADMIADRVREEELAYRSRVVSQDKRAGTKGSSTEKNTSKGGSAFLPTPQDAQQGMSSVMGRLELSEHYFSSLDSRARIRLAEKEMEMIEGKARKDFQAFIGVLFNAQRHYHARLAADFYRVLFGDGDLPPEMASQAAASAEIVNRIENDMEVFKFKASKKQIASGAKILEEAFSISRHHPALASVSLEHKLEVADYLANLNRVANMIESRDFGRLETELAKIEGEVADFDATKPRAIVNAVKRESQMRLGMAKLAAQNGDLEKAADEFRAASETWPGNPDLETASGKFFTSQDIVNQSTEEFDKAFAKRDYRAIFDQQLPFAIAVRGNAEKEGRLKESLEIVKIAEMALEKAKLLERSRDPYGAWEALELASADWPEDPALNRRRADLAVKASEFVSSVSKAKDSEAGGEKGMSLTWFLNAQTKYPASQIAYEGIKRVSDDILGKTPPPAPKAPSAAPKEEAQAKNDAGAKPESISE